jgi:hypothetical protein
MLIKFATSKTKVSKIDCTVFVSAFAWEDDPTSVEILIKFATSETKVSKIGVCERFLMGRQLHLS